MNNALILTAPNAKQWQRVHRNVDFQDKEFFILRLRGFYNFLKRKKLTIVWRGEDKKIESILNEDTYEVLTKTTGALKRLQLNLYCGIVAVRENLYKFADLMLTGESLKLAELVVRQGAVSFANIRKMLKWPEEKEHYSWYSRLGQKAESRWFSSLELAPLALMSDIMEWKKEETQREDYILLESYAVASSRLVEYILGHRNKVQLTAIEDTQGLTEFSGVDFRGKCNLLQQLMFSGALKPGKNKVTIGEIKKFANFIQLKEFPGAAAEAKERDTWTLNLVFYLFGSHKSGFDFPKAELPESEFLRRMFGLLNFKDYELFCLIFKEKPKHVTSDFHKTNCEELDLVFQLLQQTLVQADKTLHDKWTSFRSLEDVVNRLYAECNADYIMIEGSDNIKYSNGLSGKAYLPLSRIKGEVHDKIIPGILKSMALFGSVDLLFNAAGEIAALRLTDLGRWLLNISKEFPEGGLQEDDVRVFEIDDATRMVLIKQPGHPYAKLISDYAEKVSGERWRITQASILKGCLYPNDLKAKITRLKQFIIAKPGPELRRMLECMLERCEKVKHAEEEDPYILYNINRDDDMLHAFLHETPLIRENTLKVEGCGLLVRQSFEYKFVSLLRARGYLIEPED